jgi:aryl-alcohol dehydrogenase-like predicted oxidoreductase
MHGEETQPAHGRPIIGIRGRFLNYAPRVQRRSLGATGGEVGEIGLGCWQLDNPIWGGPAADESLAIVDEALRLGVNLLDTAPGYGSGRSEELVGRALEGRRERAAIVTKFGHTAAGETDFSAARVEPALAESLERLRTDRVDVFLLHNPPPELLDGGAEVYRELERLKAGGAIGAYGVSLDWAADLDRVLETTGSTVVEVLLNVFHQEPLAACERAHAKGVGVIAKVPLDSGWLTGKYGAASRFEGVRGRWSDAEIARRAELVGRFEALLPEGVAPTQGALGFLLAQECVSAVVPGAKSVAQLRDLAAATALPPAAAEALRGLWREQVEAAPLPW